MDDIRLLLLFGMVFILVVLLIFFIRIVFKKKKYYSLLDELDYMKYELSNKTVPFELAKLRSTKKSERIVVLVQQWEKRWEDLESQFVTVTENIMYAEELVSQRNFSGIDELVDEIKSDLSQLDKEIDDLLGEIQALKQTEERGRSSVIGLKKQYEELRFQYDSNRTKYTDIKAELRSVFNNIETGFFKFNECMEDCNYDLADETIEFIKSQIAILVKLIEKTPIYLESIETELRPLLREVLRSYEYITKSGIFLKHLQIEETIGMYQKDLGEVMEWIRNFEFSKIEEILIDIHENSKQMIEFMKKEVGLQETIQQDLQRLENEVEVIVHEGHALAQRYENIKENCAMLPEDEKSLELLLNEIHIIYNEKVFLLTKYEENKTATSTLSREIGYILNQLEQVKGQLSNFDRQVKGLYAGEKACRQQALDLLESFNKLVGEYQQMILPTDNEEMKQVINRGSRALLVLFDVIGKVPINIDEINKQLEHTTKTISEANNILLLEMQQAALAEKMIVYGHRYVGREGMYLVDLTIAEDQFRQGNYLDVIEKMKETLLDVEGSQFEAVYNNLSKEFGYL